jgi:hypothetical protein
LTIIIIPSSSHPIQSQTFLQQQQLGGCLFSLKEKEEVYKRRKKTTLPFPFFLSFFLSFPPSSSSWCFRFVGLAYPKQMILC